jgi:hypothetical protein
MSISEKIVNGRIILKKKEKIQNPNLQLSNYTMLSFLLTQTADNWQLTTASEKIVIFKPVETSDPTAGICFVPREDNPQKVYAILQGNSSQQDLFFQSQIDPSSYLAVSISMWELMFQEDGLGF